jgi:heme exporter protein CcmD
MNDGSFVTWLAMDGHGPFVWGAYGLASIAAWIEVIAAWRRHRRAVQAVQDARTLASWPTPGDAR